MACRMVVLFEAGRTSVQPVGAVIVGLPRTAIAMTATSFACAVAGFGMLSVVAVALAAIDWPRRAIPGGGWVAAGCVVTAAIAVLVALLPAASNASTTYE